MTRQARGPQGWRPKIGPPGKPIRNVFRIMPAHPNMPKGIPIVSVKVHFNLGPNQDTAIPCLEPYGKPCRACDWVEELFARARRVAEPDKAEQIKQLAFDQKAQFRSIAQIVDMAHPEMGVQPYFFGDKEDKLISACFLTDDDPPQFRDVAHPETGRDIVMDIDTDPAKTYKGKPVRRYVTVKAKDSPSKLHDPEWLEQIQDLVAEHVYEPSTEQVEGALQGKRVQRDQRRAIGPAAAPAPQLTAAPVPPPPPVTAEPTPTPVPARGRRAAAPTPLPPATVEPPVPSKKQPVVAAVAAPVAVGPLPFADAYARAKADVQTVFASPKDITEQELAATPLPPCYGDKNENLPTDAACQSCGVLIPCRAIVLGLLPAPPAR